MLKPLAIHYRDFWDVPRIFSVKFGGTLFVFDCPFDDEVEDYPDRYSVYVLPEMSREQIDADWAGLPAKAIRRVGEVPVSAVQFDPTKRKEIDGAIFEQLGLSQAPMNGIRTHAETPTHAG